MDNLKNETCTHKAASSCKKGAAKMLNAFPFCRQIRPKYAVCSALHYGFVLEILISCWEINKYPQIQVILTKCL